MSNHQTTQLEKAQPIIKRHVLFAVGTGFIPIPILDVVAIAAVQQDMIEQICKVFGQTYSESRGKAMVGTLTGTTFARIAASRTASFLKVIPVIGTSLGGITVSAYSGATTYAIGQVVAQHFASGGSILDFKEADLKAFYQKQLKKGRDLVKEWRMEVKKDQQPASPTMKTEQQERLEKMKELVEAGIITKEELVTIQQRLAQESDITA